MADRRHFENGFIGVSQQGIHHYISGTGHPIMSGGRIFYVGGKVGAKPRAWGQRKIDTVEH